MTIEAPRWTKYSPIAWTIVDSHFAKAAAERIDVAEETAGEPHDALRNFLHGAPVGQIVEPSFERQELRTSIMCLL